MSRELFQDNCKGCEPAVVDPNTGRPLTEGSPIMRAVQAFWKTTTWDERFAFHQMTCLNSTVPEVMETVKALIDRMEMALREIP